MPRQKHWQTWSILLSAKTHQMRQCESQAYLEPCLTMRGLQKKMQNSMRQVQETSSPENVLPVLS